MMTETVKHLKETIIDGVIYRIGDKVPHKERKLNIRPNAPVDNRPSFKPVRKG